MKNVMYRELRAGISWTALLSISCLSLAGQTAPRDGFVSSASISAAQSQTSLTQTSGQVIYREIDDPSTGNKWLLLRDNTHPGGPGRLVLVAGPPGAARSAGSAGSQPGPRSNAIALIPLIHAGDRLIVEKNTAIVNERLEAVALGPGFKGSSFEVRLEIGGKVFRAVALGAGLAEFAAEAEGQQ